MTQSGLEAGPSECRGLSTLALLVIKCMIPFNYGPNSTLLISATSVTTEHCKMRGLMQKHSAGKAEIQPFAAKRTPGNHGFFFLHMSATDY